LSARFEELAWSESSIGLISLRRRIDPALQVEVYEVKLDDEFLMSSLFTTAEVELARLALAALSGTDLDILVGGLGLGYTARAALDDPRVRTLTVVEAIAEVIEWHHRELLPNATELTSDARTRLLHGDFFALIGDERSLGGPDTTFDAVLVDIDHSPHHLLDSSHAAFYTPQGLRRLRDRVRPSGVFGLWSDDPPDEVYLSALRDTFTKATAHIVSFANPYTAGQSANTIYLAQR